MIIVAVSSMRIVIKHAPYRPDTWILFMRKPKRSTSFTIGKVSHTLAWRKIITHTSTHFLLITLQIGLDMYLHPCRCLLRIPLTNGLHNGKMLLGSQRWTTRCASLCAHCNGCGPDV